MIWLRRLLILVLSLVVLAVLALGVFLWTFDPNAYKDDIIAAAESRLGRSLALKGAVQMTLYPWVGITAEGIEIDNPEGFGTGPMLKAGQIALRARLWPLLSRQLEMDTVRLSNAEIQFIRLADGRDNWSGLGQAAAAASPATPAPSEPVSPEPISPAPVSRDRGPPALAALVIGGVDIQGLKLHWDDAVSGQRFTLTEFTATTGPLQFGQAVSLEARGRLDAQQPALKGTFTLVSTLSYDATGERFELKPVTLTGEFTGPALPGGKGSLKAATSIGFDRGSRQLNVQALSVEALGHQLEGDLTTRLPEAGEAPKFSAKLTGAGPDLASLFRALGLEPLASDLARLKQRDFKLKLEASADPAAGGLKLPVFALDILGARFEASAGQVGERIEGRLRAAGPNLPALLATLGGAHLLTGPAQGIGQALRDYGAVPEFSLNTDFATTARADALTLTGFSAQVLGGQLTSQSLALAGLATPKASIKGDIAAEGADVVAWLALIAATDASKDDPLERNLPNLKTLADRRYAIKAAIDVAAATGRVEIKGLDATVLGARLQGEIATQGANYAGTFRLASEQARGLMTLLGNAALGAALQRFDLELPISGDAGALKVPALRLTALVNGPEGALPLSLGAALEASPRAGDYALKDLKLAGLGMDIQGDLSLKGLSAAGARELNGSLSAPPFNLRQVLQSLKQTLPVMADPKALTAVGVSLEVASQGQQFALRDLALDLDGAKLSGNVRINDWSGPDLSFELKGDRLDTTRYLPPRSATVTPETAAAGATQLPLALLRNLKLTGRAQFDELVLSGLRLKGVEVNIKAAEGRLEAAPVKAGLYEGSYSGSVGLDAQGDSARMTIDSALKGVQIEPLLRDLQGRSRLKGRGDVDMQLTATGRDSAALSQALSGTIAIRLNDGAIRGVNLGKLMRQLQSGVFSNVDTESTDFTELLARVDCQQGVCRNEDFSMKSPLLRLTGSGVVVDLPNDRIDYVIQANLVDTAAGQGGQDLASLKGVTIPIKVTGNTNAPKYGIDFGGLVRKKAEDEARRLIGEKLGITLPGDSQARETGAAPASDPNAAPASDPNAAGQEAAPTPSTPKEAAEQKAREAVQQGLKKLLKF